MIQLFYYDYVIVFIMIFLAGWIDAIAGGGGLISLPTYLIVGLPPHFALGSNKFSSCSGTIFTTIRYFRNNMIDLPIAFSTALFALIGSWIGARTVLLIQAEFLNYILICLIPIIAVINMLNKNIGKINKSIKIKNSKKMLLAISAGLMIGFYDGFFGPGTGTFLIIVYTLLLKYDFVTANANTKLVNLASNLAAVFTFAFTGNIYYKLAIPAAIFGVTGNLIGSKMVILRGNKLIREIFFLVLFLLMARVIWNIFF
jgi:uncharacterized membrane protein YfcA